MEGLAHEGEDWAIWTAVVTKALELYDERETAKVRAMGRVIGSEVGAVVARALSQMFS